MAKEWLDVVDERGEPTGQTVLRTAAHREGIRHRTSHLWLLRRRDGAVEILLQHRSANKDSYPNCYDISSAGHIPAGCGFVESALRELQEELGLTAAPDDLHYCGQRHFFSEHEFYGEPFRDRQVSNVYAMWWDGDLAALTLQESEVQGVKWMPLAECQQAVAAGDPAYCVFPDELELLAKFVSSAD